MDREQIRRIGFLLNHTDRFLQSFYIKKLIEHNISLSYDECSLIIASWHYEGSNQQVLADALFKEKTAILRLIDSLESKQMVRREKDPNDRRNNLIFLTDEGREMRKRLLEIGNDALLKIFSNLEQIDLDKTEEILANIYNFLKPDNIANYDKNNFKRLRNESNK